MTHVRCMMKTRRQTNEREESMYGVNNGGISILANLPAEEIKFYGWNTDLEVCMACFS